MGKEVARRKRQAAMDILKRRNVNNKAEIASPGQYGSVHISMKREDTPFSDATGHFNIALATGSALWQPHCLFHTSSALLCHLTPCDSFQQLAEALEERSNSVGNRFVAIYSLRLASMFVASRDSRISAIASVSNVSSTLAMVKHSDLFGQRLVSFLPQPTSRSNVNLKLRLPLATESPSPPPPCIIL